MHDTETDQNLTDDESNFVSEKESDSDRIHIFETILISKLAIISKLLKVLPDIYC